MTASFFKLLMLHFHSMIELIDAVNASRLQLEADLQHLRQEFVAANISHLQQVVDRCLAFVDSMTASTAAPESSTAAPAFNASCLLPSATLDPATASEHERAQYSNRTNENLRRRFVLWVVT